MRMLKLYLHNGVVSDMKYDSDELNQIQQLPIAMNISCVATDKLIMCIASCLHFVTVLSVFGDYWQVPRVIDCTRRLLRFCAWMSVDRDL